MKTVRTISGEIAGLFDTDQADRKKLGHSLDIEVLASHDQVRLLRAREISDAFESGGIDLSADDLYMLAMLFQQLKDFLDKKSAIC